MSFIQITISSPIKTDYHFYCLILPTFETFVHAVNIIKSGGNLYLPAKTYRSYRYLNSKVYTVRIVQRE